MTIEPEVALRAMLRAMKTPMDLPEYPALAVRGVGRANDSEAEEIRALLRLPPLSFYGELEDRSLQRLRCMMGTKSGGQNLARST